MVDPEYAVRALIRDQLVTIFLKMVNVQYYAVLLTPYVARMPEFTQAGFLEDQNNYGHNIYSLGLRIRLYALSSSVNVSIRMANRLRKRMKR